MRRFGALALGAWLAAELAAAPAVAQDAVRLPPVPVPSFTPKVPSPEPLMPEQAMTRTNMAALQAWFDGPIREADGRIQYLAILDPKAIERTVPREAARARIDAIARPWHRADTRETVAQIEDELGLRVDRVFSTLIEGFAAILDDAQAEKLRDDPRVARLEPNRRIAFSGGIWADAQVNDEMRPWGVAAMGGPLSGLESAPVFVVDSGVRPHADLNTVAAESVAGRAANGCYQHATFIAGVIGARRNSSLTVGVRPNSAIWSIGAGDNSVPPCEALGGLDATTVTAALELVRQRTRERCQWQGDCRPGIVNLSFNSTWTAGSVFSTLVASLTTANWAESFPGVLVVHSAGNGRPSERQEPPGGVLLDANRYTLPSTPWDGYVRVGGLDVNGQPVRPLNSVGGFFNLRNFAFSAAPIWQGGPSFLEAGSNFGPSVDVWAPSKLVRSSVVVPALSGGQFSVVQALGSGTSFAAPHIAALAARLRENSSNWSTAGSLEQALRARFFNSGARDLSGAVVAAASAPGTHPHRARPTVEFRGGIPSWDAQVGPHAPLSANTIDWTVRSNETFSLRLDSTGTNVCSDQATWNGQHWFAWNGIAPQQHWQNLLWPWPGAVVVWRVTCQDIFDPSITTTAAATIRVVAPSAPRLTWRVNDHAVNMSNADHPITLQSWFSLRVEAEGMSSCTVRAWVWGFRNWSWLDPHWATPWYGPVPISHAGHNWQSVLLTPDKYTWMAQCFDPQGIQHTRFTHVQVLP